MRDEQAGVAAYISAISWAGFFVLLIVGIVRALLQ